MIRKLLLPAVAIALLGGCMTSGYSYRQDRGDYYYGQPSTDYRYYGSPYGGGYGGYYDRYGYPYGGGYYYYSHPYYNYPYYGRPYYPHRPRPPVVVVPRPGDDTPPPPRPDDGHIDDGNRRAPWRDPNHFRNLDNLRRRHADSAPAPQSSAPSAAAPAPARTMVVRPRADDGGSRSQQVMRRARDKARSSEAEK